MGKIQLELQGGAAGPAVVPHGWGQASGGCKGAAGAEEKQVEMLPLEKENWEGRRLTEEMEPHRKT